MAAIPERILRLRLIAAVVLNLGVLGYIKYANFFIDNMNFVLHAEVSSPDAGTAGTGCSDEHFQHAASKFLLKSFHELESSRNARVIFLLAPGYRREQGVVAGGIRDVDSFADRAAHDGFAVVHMEAAFSAALRSGTRLDFLPIDGHWNVAANALAAQAAADAISHDLP